MIDRNLLMGFFCIISVLDSGLDDPTQFFPAWKDTKYFDFYRSSFRGVSVTEREGVQKEGGERKLREMLGRGYLVFNTDTHETH